MAYSPTFTIKHDPNVGKYTIHGSYKGYIYIFTYILKYRERYTSIYSYIYTTPNDFPQTRSTTAVIHFLLIPGEGWRQTWLSNLSGKPNLIGHVFLDLHHEKPQKVNSSPLKMDG